MSVKTKVNNVLHYLVDETDLFYKTNVGKKFKKVEICPDSNNGTSLLFHDADGSGYYVISANSTGLYYIRVNASGQKTTLGHIQWGGV